MREYHDYFNDDDPDNSDIKNKDLAVLAGIFGINGSPINETKEEFIKRYREEKKENDPSREDHNAQVKFYKRKKAANDFINKNHYAILGVFTTDLDGTHYYVIAHKVYKPKTLEWIDYIREEY